VFMYHDVPPHLVHYFSAHLKWLSTRFEFVRPSDLFGPSLTGERPKALLTFDDGCIDNYEIVAPLLESIGVRGLFFVCPAFSDASESESYRLLERSAGSLGERNRDSRWQRMSRAQILALDQRGHGIGNHTMTHAALAHIPQEKLHGEIVESSDLLSEWLGHACHFFAWTYYWDEITASALKLILERHALCFSPCSGLNPWPVNRMLWRTAIDVSKSLPHLKTQISGAVDYLYRPKRVFLTGMSAACTSIQPSYPGSSSAP
jgi:peptidoglycan/xylan/chitin deacetylase (PgdA/CDA1 family)